jgi:G3E family GTPase
LPAATTFDFTDQSGDSLCDVAKIDTMVTVVDAHNLLADYTRTDLLEQRGETAGPDDTRTLAALLAEQIEFADVVVVNKIDKVDATRRDERRAPKKLRLAPQDCDSLALALATGLATYAGGTEGRGYNRVDSDPPTSPRHA